MAGSSSGVIRGRIGTRVAEEIPGGQEGGGEEAERVERGQRGHSFGGVSSFVDLGLDQVRCVAA